MIIIMVNNLQKLIAPFFVTIIIIFFCGLVTSDVQAASYDLVAPTGPLQRGQEVQFTISIDTEGQTITSTQIGMTYQADFLQYVSATPGDTFPTITTDTQEGGKLIFTATKDGGFSGTGTFATVTFKLIATAPGTAELCVLFNPENTPTPAPQTQPTALPKTGNVEQTGKGIILGSILLMFAGGNLLLANKKSHRSSLHKR